MEDMMFYRNMIEILYTYDGYQDQFQHRVSDYLLYSMFTPAPWRPISTAELVTWRFIFIIFVLHPAHHFFFFLVNKAT